MYRVNTFTYLIEALLGTGLANAPMTCAENEYVRFVAPGNESCGVYMSEYMKSMGGYLLDINAKSCEYCPVTQTNTFLIGVNINFDNRWRNVGILTAFCIFNAIAAVGLYWLGRVPRGKKN